MDGRARREPAPAARASAPVAGLARTGPTPIDPLLDPLPDHVVAGQAASVPADRRALPSDDVTAPAVHVRDGPPARIVTPGPGARRRGPLRRARPARGPGRRRGRLHRRPLNRRRLRRAGTQVTETFVLGIIVPFVMYVMLDELGYDITKVVYVAVVLSLVVTATLMWIEARAALEPTAAPDPVFGPPPPASAIIAAFLPNEKDTIVETIGKFLGLDYRGPLQVILACNGGDDLPVVDQLRRIEALDARFVLLAVRASKSKAENVNAALSLVTGRFVGVFDADHHPAADAFDRAACWLEGGYDIVQGHNVVRNGDDSPSARLVAVEFEQIYAVFHPGRARVHGWGIFGGSNGFWRTPVLRSVKMDPAMLTEDIDSSMRALLDGHRIASDPGLVSRELATVTLRQLWHQRIRWAQGWYQVSKKYAWASLRSDVLTMRQKVGTFHLLVWREVYPWLSLQIWPLVAFGALRRPGWAQIDWMLPIWIATSAYVVATGPALIFLVYRKADPEVRRTPAWFLKAMVSSIWYSEFKNLINRVAQLKEAQGEHDWRVTPRLTSSAPAPAAASPPVTGPPVTVAGAAAEVLDAPADLEAALALVPARASALHGGGPGRLS